MPFSLPLHAAPPVEPAKEPRQRPTLAFNVLTQKDSMVVTRDSSVMEMAAIITMVSPHNGHGHGGWVAAADVELARRLQEVEHHGHATLLADAVDRDTADTALPSLQSQRLLNDKGAPSPRLNYCDWSEKWRVMQPPGPDGVLQPRTGDRQLVPRKLLIPGPCSISGADEGKESAHGTGGPNSTTWRSTIALLAASAVVQRSLATA